MIWSCRFAKEKEALCIDVVKGKYGEESEGGAFVLKRRGLGWGYGNKKGSGGIW